MRKIVLVALVCIAVPIYVWDALQVVRKGAAPPRVSETVAMVSAAPPQRLVGMRAPKFVPANRSPFEISAASPAPSRPAPAPKREVAPPPPMPPVTISGIMWNPTNPVAIVAVGGGSSAAVKTGQAVSDGITVKKIEPARVLFTYGGHEYWITK